MLAKNWIEAQYAREELAIKQINAGATDQEQTIRIEGGLPQLPGTNTIMPVLDHGPATNGRPSLRHSSAMLSSPRKPSSTMRIFSSAE